MKTTCRTAAFIVILMLAGVAGENFAYPQEAIQKRYERLVNLPPPKIITNAIAYPGKYNVERIIDGNPKTEYSSRGDGTNTFIEFDFGAMVEVVGFRHIDRNDPATVASSELIFKDDSGKVVETVQVIHANKRAGVTFLPFQKPIKAKTVRWRVTGLGPQNFPTVGGAEIAFLGRGEAEEAPFGTTITAEPVRMIEKKDGALAQSIRAKINHPYRQTASAFLRVDGLDYYDSRIIQLKPGETETTIYVPAGKSRSLTLALECEGRDVAKTTVKISPPIVKEIYLLPHSHVDIGYTAIQPDVRKKQNENIDIAMELIRKTSAYPEGSKFIWNMEVLWPVENYLQDATPEKREAFIKAIKEGRIGLDAFYGNILTGLCRPEELLRMMSYGLKLSEMFGVKIESAMISDVPGYTWSTVTAMAHSGVKYFSFAPNYFDRMGRTMVTWQDKPFWWVSPDGKNKVLCWCPTRGYALGHLIGHGEALARFIPQYLGELEEKKYPYDITYLRWNVHGDNGSPDELLSDVVRQWNERYAEPKLVIAKTADAFRRLEQKYGKNLPVYRGDYTPYWEDGAGSSAFETAMNRASAERLVQSETLWAIKSLKPFPALDFYDGWRNVLLYSEHTWGAFNSVSEPDKPFVKEQWRIKRSFAVDADTQSRRLLEQVLKCDAQTASDEVDVFNTTSWLRTDLVIVPASLSRAGERVVDQSGKAVPSQRLSNGDLAFVASLVPPFGSKRYKISAGEPAGGEARAVENRLENTMFELVVDENSGAIKSFKSFVNAQELVDARAQTALNDYFYLPGSDVKNVQRNGRPKITVKEKGPVVASLLVESDAPGCKKLIREIRVVHGLNRVELINTVEKLPIRKKEGAHFGFGFNVPDGTVRLDVGLAAIRPNIDQIPAACKNWFSVQRWVDVSNSRYGVTLATVDAPLVEVGGLTANLIGSQTNPDVWIKELPRSSTIYSWIMNNHWHTNYRAEQDDTVIFRYFMRPHCGYSPALAYRFGIECSQPLLVAKACGSVKSFPRVFIDSEDVIATALKPSDDGKAVILRLFGNSGKTTTARIYWDMPFPKSLWLSDTSEKPLKQIGNSIQIPGWGVVTIRAQME